MKDKFANATKALNPANFDGLMKDPGALAKLLPASMQNRPELQSAMQLMQSGKGFEQQVSDLQTKIDNKVAQAKQKIQSVQGD